MDIQLVSKTDCKTGIGTIKNVAHIPREGEYVHYKVGEYKMSFLVVIVIHSYENNKAFITLVVEEMDTEKYILEVGKHGKEN